MNSTLFFIIFILIIIGMLTLDLGVFHKKNAQISFKESLIWTCVWIGVSLLFYLFIYSHAEWIHGIDNIEDLLIYKETYGRHLNIDETLSYQDNLQIFRKTLSLEYLTGYLVEKTLSLDNIFVMLLIFTSFKVDPKYYHRVLFYGILGAIVLRFVFIFLSSALIQRFHIVLLIFGLFLLYTGIKMFFNKKEEENLDVIKHPVVRFLAKFKITTPEYHGEKFFIRKSGKLMLTPLFVVLLIIEFSDVIFAVDSIPAIFCITEDPYIVFFSNIFAILGLRSLFFVLQSVVDKFQYLKTGLAFLLTFIGIKMVLPFINDSLVIPTSLSLVIIVSILLISILASIFFPKKRV